MRRISLVLTVAVIAVSAAVVEAGAAELRGYGGESPFNCELQQVGTGVDFPRPDADPFCVEYDKTHQNVTELGVVDFLANEPARVAIASDKCFYYQADHWRGSVEQSPEQSETYNWDGGYFFDKARGVFGTYVENFTLNNASFDPTGFPGFPEQWKPFFGYARGGIQLADSIPVDPACVEKAERENVYRAADPAAKGEVSLRLRYRRGRTASGRRCVRSAVRMRIEGKDLSRVEKVAFRFGRKTLRVDRSAPFDAKIAHKRIRRSGKGRAHARVRFADGTQRALARTLRACPKPQR